MKVVKIIFILAAVAVIAVIGMSYWLYSSLATAHPHEKANEFIVIEKGSSPSAIVDKLTAEGVIASPLATRLYLRTIGNSQRLQAGEYQFASPITPLQVLKELEKGETQTIKLTIPEGFTRFDIAKRIAEKFGTPDTNSSDSNKTPFTDQQVLLLMEDTDLIRDIAPEARQSRGLYVPKHVQRAA